MGLQPRGPRRKQRLRSDTKDAVTLMVRHGTDRRHATRPGSREHLGYAPTARAVLAASAVGALAPPRERSGAGASEEGAVGASWHHAKQVSALLPAEADTRVSRRHVRYAQREVLWSQSSIERVRKCGRVPVQEGGVAIKDNGGVAHYSGLATCGSIWACPVCSAKIRNRRAEEISTATAEWDRAGNSVYMATFTAPHDLGMRLGPLMSAIKEAFTQCLSGRAWIALKKRLGIVGQIRSLEITHGDSGWHPHLHVLIYVNGDLDAEGLAALVGHLRKQWRIWITRAGYRPPHDIHGVDVGRCTSAKEAGEYIAKTQDGKGVGNEVARGDLKQARRGGRTPLGILDDFRWTGDLDDLRLWGEYERATKSRQAITWSQGLRKLLAPDEQEQSNGEIAAEEVGGNEVAIIEGDDWRAITGVPGMTGYLLDAYEQSGLDGVKAALRRNPRLASIPDRLRTGT